MPPALGWPPVPRAMAIAVWLSVTEFILAEIIGRPRRISGDKGELISTLLRDGISEYCGRSRTSSKVKAIGGLKTSGSDIFSIV